jgi:hypothetical protein
VNRSDEDLPYAVREETIEVSGVKLRCCLLSDGRRVILKEDAEAYLRHMDKEIERALKADEEGE